MLVLPAEEGKSLFCVLGTLRSLCWSSLACIRRERRISLGCGRWCYPSVCSQSLTSLTEPRALSLTEPWEIKNNYVCVGDKLASGKIWKLSYHILIESWKFLTLISSEPLCSMFTSSGFCLTAFKKLNFKKNSRPIFSQKLNISNIFEGSANKLKNHYLQEAVLVGLMSKCDF